jgi:hypothetical protein
MRTKNNWQTPVVFGLFSTKEQVETAVDEMKREGFRNADISVLFPYNEGTKDFALKKGTKAPEGAAAGATSGAVIGGALGWLAGIGVLAIPGVGPFIAAGPMMALLGGVGVGAAQRRLREYGQTQGPDERLVRRAGVPERLRIQAR